MKRKLTISALLLAAASALPILHGGVIGTLLDEDFLNPAIWGSAGAGVPIGQDYDQQIGDGPYRAEGNAVLGNLFPPKVEIGSPGEARFDDLVTTTLFGDVNGDVVGNNARLYRNDIGHVFEQGFTYTFDVHFRSDEFLSAQVLTGMGFGLQFLAGGVEVASTPANLQDLPAAQFEIFGDEMSGRITFEWVAGTADFGNSIGIGAFVGRDEGLLTFGTSNCGFLAITHMQLAAIPEPSSVAALLAGLAFVAALARRRRFGRLNERLDRRSPGG